MRSRILAAFLLVAAAVGGCTRGVGQVTEALSAGPSGPAATTPTATPSGAIGASSIAILRPPPDSEVASPVRIRGVALGGGELLVQVFDARGLMLVAMNVRASCSSAGCRGKFRAKLFFYTESPQPGAVVVTRSAVTPAEQARVPVTLVP